MAKGKVGPEINCPKLNQKVGTIILTKGWVDFTSPPLEVYPMCGYCVRNKGVCTHPELSTDRDKSKNYPKCPFHHIKRL